MPNDRLAERILLLTTDPERAASTVGDLREAAATRGEAWFWASVLGTAGSLAWRGMAVQPKRMAGLAVQGFLFNMVLQGALALVTGIAILLPLGAGAGSFNPWYGPQLLVLAVISQFLTGGWIGRRAPGREWSACLALTMLLIVADTIFTLVFMPDRPWQILTALAGHCCYFLGAFSLRRRTA